MALITLPPLPPKQKLRVRTKEEQEQAQASETAHVKLPSIPEKLPTSSDKKYIVYEYVFPDGKNYIGRSREDQGRIGNWETYKEQYVYKAMKKYEGKIKTYILLETTNIFYAFATEHKAIEIHYNHSYNAGLEWDWFDKALTYLARYIHPTAEEVTAMLQEYLQKQLIIVIPTKHQVLIK